MTFKELREAQEELGLDNDEMAEALGIRVRSYYYRKAGELPITYAEARLVERMVAEKRGKS